MATNDSRETPVLFDPPQETREQRVERLHREYVACANVELVVGLLVRIDSSSEVFEYGGTCPFGGVVEAVFDDGDANVRWFCMDEDGAWGWVTQTVPIGDLEVIRP